MLFYGIIMPIKREV